MCPQSLGKDFFIITLDLCETILRAFNRKGSYILIPFHTEDSAIGRLTQYTYPQLTRRQRSLSSSFWELEIALTPGYRPVLMLKMRISIPDKDSIFVLIIFLFLRGGV
jgi:hypothetical protein